MLRRPKGERVLRPVHPNAGYVAAYRSQLEKLIEQMHGSTLYWLKAQYRANPPQMAQDFALPANVLAKTIKWLRKKWLSRFDDAAVKVARYFAKAVHNQTDRQMRKILRDAGFTVKFDLTKPMQDVMAAAIHENVSLIKSIPEQYLNDVEGIIMRSVQAGHDLGYIATQIEDRYGLTKKRAALIARDQTNKVTAQFTRVRQIEAGIERAVWLHSHAGKVPRPTHVDMDGTEYDVAEGMYDPAKGVQRYIHPGELINCRCVSKSIVKGFS